MQLIIIDKGGKVHVRDGMPMASRPVSREITLGIRSLIDSPEEAAKVEEAHRKYLKDAAVLSPMPVGGEDAYIAAKKK